MVKEEGNKQKCASAHCVVHALNSGECDRCKNGSFRLPTGIFHCPSHEEALFRIFAKVYLKPPYTLCTVSGRGVIKSKQKRCPKKSSVFFLLNARQTAEGFPPPQRRVGSLNGLIPPPFHFHGRTGGDPPPPLQKKGLGTGEE